MTNILLALLITIAFSQVDVDDETQTNNDESQTDYSDSER